MPETGGARVNRDGNECWIVETSKDGDRWRFFGKAWKRPRELLLLHGVPRFLRVRLDGARDWLGPLERTDDLPITLVDTNRGVRSELWPDESHLGLPLLLPGGETGRLVSFDHQADPVRWTYTLEFRGSAE